MGEERVIVHLYIIGYTPTGIEAKSKIDKSDQIVEQFIV